MDVYDQFDKRGFIVGVFRGVRSFRIDPEGPDPLDERGEHC